MYFSGKEIVLLPYDNNNERQQWVIHGNTIHSRTSPQEVLMYKGGGMFSTAHIVAAEKDGSDQQHWSFDYIPDQSLSLK